MDSANYFSLSQPVMITLSSTDIGVISGALLYIRDDFKQVERSTVLQVQFACFLLKYRIILSTLSVNELKL